MLSVLMLFILAHNHICLNEFYSSIKSASYLYEYALSLFKTLWYSSNDMVFFQAYNRMRWQTSSTQLSSTSRSMSLIKITTNSIEFSRVFLGKQTNIHMTLQPYSNRAANRTNEIFIHEIYGILSQKLMTPIPTTMNEIQVFEI